MRKKTHEEFVKDVYAIHGDEYTVLGEYVNNRTKIKMKHNKCGHEWEVISKSILNGRGCPKCSGKMKKTHEDFVKEVFELVGDEYTVLGEYVTNKTKIKMKHNTCGHEYEVIPNSILKGTGCPKCSGNMKKTHEDFVKEVKEKYGDEYTVLGEYINIDTKIKMKHNKCGHEWEVIPYSILNGTGCPKCSGTMKKTHEDFVKEVFELVGDEYTVLGEYVTNNTKIKMKHNTCGHEWEVAPSNILNGRGCPNCKKSKGEKAIENKLTNDNIEHEKQYKCGCKNKQELPFDNALFKDGKLICLIEFDGKQHFEPIEFYGGEEGFKYRKQNDLIKSKYCAEHNIPLVRIPYWEYDQIDEILEKIYKFFNLK